VDSGHSAEGTVMAEYVSTGWKAGWVRACLLNGLWGEAFA